MYKQDHSSPDNSPQDNFLHSEFTDAHSSPENSWASGFVPEADCAASHDAVHVDLQTTLDQARCLRHTQEALNAVCSTLYRWGCFTNTVEPYALERKLHKFKQTHVFPPSLLCSCAFAVADACLARQQQCQTEDSEQANGYAFAPNLFGSTNLAFARSLFGPSALFTPNAPVVYSDDTLTWDCLRAHVGLWTLDGWLDVPFICGPARASSLTGDKFSVSLHRVGAHFFLKTRCREKS